MGDRFRFWPLMRIAKLRLRPSAYNKAKLNYAYSDTANSSVNTPLLIHIPVCLLCYITSVAVIVSVYKS